VIALSARKSSASEVPLQLTPGAVHLWLLQVDAVDNPASCCHLLSVEELSRCERLPVESRAEAILTRALLRTTLSRYNSIDPASWEFAAGEHGKPCISAPATELTFNLSHSDGWIVCAVSAGLALGVDLQFCEPARNIDRLARRYFSPEEAALVAATDGRGKQGLFYDLWTLKEAHTKALGGAIAAGLGAYGFDLSRPGVVVALPPEGVHFLWDLTPEHRLALCLLPEARASAQVQLFRCLQFAHFEPFELAARAVGQGW
jgi:4'-phosphopantetheinyl transferase